MTSKLYVLLLLVIMCWEIDGKGSEERSHETRGIKSDATALIFADEFKQTIEKYLFGICPQPYKMPLDSKNKNGTTFTCDLDTDQQDLAGRLATLSLRAHSAARSDCLRLGAALASSLGDLARTAAGRQPFPSGSAETKKRKLSKSQKMQIKAKQRTALAVKKKAAAVAAAAAAKIAS